MLLFLWITSYITSCLKDYIMVINASFSPQPENTYMKHRDAKCESQQVKIGISKYSFDLIKIFVWETWNIKQKYKRD